VNELGGMGELEAAVDALDVQRRWAREWLFDAALPLWWEVGADRINGGYFDRLDQQARPLSLQKRLRVQARQAFVYAEAGRLGWDGPWRDATMDCSGHR
jgi:mannose/cellobiose epimerase-like protein (N-acyl-D-glucosamine 2-epimerase family)